MPDNDINRACALHWVNKQPLCDICHVQYSAIGIGARNRPITAPHFSRHFCTQSISRYFLVSSLTVHVGP